MTIYSGETLRIRVTAKDYDGNPITDLDVTSAQVFVYDSTSALVDTFPGTLTWDGVKNYWYFDWDTVSDDVGAFKVKARFVGVAYDTWEIATVRLKQSPV